MMRIAVAGQKALETNDTGGIRRTDQHRPAGSAPDQADAAQNERAHDALAEIGLSDHQRAQPFGRDQQRLDVAFGMAVHQRRTRGQLTDLGQELAGPLIDDRRDTAEAITLRNGDMAGQHDEHSGPDLAGLKQRFAVVIVTILAEPAHPRDFLHGQCREGLLVAREGAGEADAPAGFSSDDNFFRHDLRLILQTDPIEDIPQPAWAANQLFTRGFLHRRRRPHHQNRATLA